ncbi:MAG: hypothetical protein PF630_09015 [Gammaproteobacteria bacterium]|jgi:hypothetical protein|nr:hypothetical protein [Gammaproteobacteria bacterium]
MRLVLDQAARAWCQEQLRQHYPQWQLIEIFMPRSWRSEYLLLHGVLTAIMHIPLAPLSPEAALRKLEWWLSALHGLAASRQQAAISPTLAVTDAGNLQHPALRCLVNTDQCALLETLPLTVWAEDLQACIELQGIADGFELADWCRRLSWPLHWLDARLSLPTAGAADAHQTHTSHTTDNHYAERLLLQQINTLPARNWLYRHLPMTLRARHQLQIDTGSITAFQHAETGSKPDFTVSGSLLLSLLAVRQQCSASRATAALPASGSSLPARLWRVANDEMQRCLQRRRNSNQVPSVSGTTAQLAWACWRVAKSA